MREYLEFDNVTVAEVAGYLELSGGNRSCGVESLGACDGLMSGIGLGAFGGRIDWLLPRRGSGATLTTLCVNGLGTLSTLGTLGCAFHIFGGVRL